MASYSGSTEYGPSTSSPLTQTVNPAVTVGPRVLGVDRFGYHALPTTLVVRFDSLLDPASAQNAQNYVITGPGGRRVAVVSAV